MSETGWTVDHKVCLCVRVFFLLSQSMSSNIVFSVFSFHRLNYDIINLRSFNI